MFQNIFNNNQDLKIAKIFNIYQFYSQLSSTIEKKKIQKSQFFSRAGLLLTVAGSALAGIFLGTVVGFTIGIISLLFTILSISKNERLENNNEAIAHHHMRKELISHIKDRNDLFTLIYELENINKIQSFFQLEALIADIKNIYSENNFFIEDVVRKISCFIDAYYVKAPNNHFENEYKNFVKHNQVNHPLYNQLDNQQMEIGNVKNIL